jgi:divalent metal cation (Fe/Co/Zn/Cd) transporter
MRQPTREERGKEISLYAVIGADTLIVLGLTLFAIATGSLTILGEAIRSILMLAISYYSLWVLMALHRDRLQRFQFGVEKLEQFVWMLIGFGLFLSALWMTRTVIDAVVSAQAAASPLGLTWAAIINAVNCVINILSWYAVFSTSRDGESEVYEAVLRSRMMMMVSSLSLQITLTAAALARDTAIALTLDVIGATFVIVVMLRGGISMMARALPNLLDTAAPSHLMASIRDTVATIVADEHIHAVRTRSAGPVTFAEVAVSVQAFPSVDALHEGTVTIKQALGDAKLEVDLTLVVAPQAETNPR